MTDAGEQIATTGWLSKDLRGGYSLQDSEQCWKYPLDWDILTLADPAAHCRFAKIRAFRF